jgi:hypothetical protein
LEFDRAVDRGNLTVKKRRNEIRYLEMGKKAIESTMSPVTKKDCAQLLEMEVTRKPFISKRSKSIQRENINNDNDDNNNNNNNGFLSLNSKNYSPNTNTIKPTAIPRAGSKDSPTSHHNPNANPNPNSNPKAPERSKRTTKSPRIASFKSSEKHSNKTRSNFTKTLASNYTESHQNNTHKNDRNDDDNPLASVLATVMIKEKEIKKESLKIIRSFIKCTSFIKNLENKISQDRSNIENCVNKWNRFYRKVVLQFYVDSLQVSQEFSASQLII